MTFNKQEVQAKESRTTSPCSGQTISFEGGAATLTFTLVKLN